MTSDLDASPADQAAAGSVVFGLVSLALCWWFPFGPIVGTIGAALGVFGWWTCRGNGISALVGMFLAATGAGAGLLLAWNYWWRLFAL